VSEALIMSESEHNRQLRGGLSPRELRMQARIEELEAQLRIFADRNVLMMEYYARMWADQMGSFRGRWTSMDERVMVVEFVERWVTLSGVSRLRLLEWIGVSESKFFNWKRQVTDADKEQALTFDEERDIAAQ